MSLTNLTDEYLLEKAAEFAAEEKRYKAAGEQYRAELLRRMCDDGLQLMEGELADATLAKEPVSLAWLKRQFGYEADSLPEGIMKEKIVPDLDAEALLNWLRDEGHDVKPTYSLRIKLKPQGKTKM